MQSGSPRGKEINEIIKKGELVPLDIVLQLLKEAIRSHLPTSKGYLIDGYPRTVDQAGRFENEVCRCTHLVYFDASDNMMLKRLVKRGETSGRVDDNEETIMRRLKTFHEESKPVLDKYKDIVKTISAEEDADKVFEMVVPIFDTIAKTK